MYIYKYIQSMFGNPVEQQIPIIPNCASPNRTATTPSEFIEPQTRTHGQHYTHCASNQHLPERNKSKAAVSANCFCCCWKLIARTVAREKDGPIPTKPDA